MRRRAGPVLRRRDDDGGDDVAGEHRAGPTLVLVAVNRVAFADDVALRLPVAVALVERAQSVLERSIGHVLQPGIERRRHRESVLVQHFRAILALEVLANLFDEERRDARRLRRLAARHDRLLLGGVGLRLGEVALVRHPLQDEVPARRRTLHVDEGTLTLGRLKNPGDQRGFLERELLVPLVEVQAGGGLDAVGAVARGTSGCSRW